MPRRVRSSARCVFPRRGTLVAGMPGPPAPSRDWRYLSLRTAEQRGLNTIPISTPRPHFVGVYNPLVIVRPKKIPAVAESFFCCYCFSFAGALARLTITAELPPPGPGPVSWHSGHISSVVQIDPNFIAAPPSATISYNNYRVFAPILLALCYTTPHRSSSAHAVEAAHRNSSGFPFQHTRL